MEHDKKASAQLAVAMAAHAIEVKHAKTEGECHACNTRVFVDMGSASGKPGLIYSMAGMREYRISGTCETCFDGMFEGDEEED